MPTCCKRKYDFGNLQEVALAHRSVRVTYSMSSQIAWS
jgi:hypothetical protein